MPLLPSLVPFQSLATTTTDYITIAATTSCTTCYTSDWNMLTSTIQQDSSLYWFYRSNWTGTIVDIFNRHSGNWIRPVTYNPEPVNMLNRNPSGNWSAPAEPINREAARFKARELLCSFLTEEQRIEFEAHKRFTVVGKDKIYRINYGFIANIEVLSMNRQRQHALCVHPENDGLPIEDIMLSQLLHLRADEAALVRRANVHP
jgi:hypothetical protein